MCSSLASYPVDNHGEMIPCCCIHDRLRRLQKIEVALERRDREYHATNAWTEASCPGIGCVDEPIRLYRSPVCHQCTNAISMEHGANNLGLLLDLNAQFFCPSEPFSIDHMWEEEAVSRTPGRSRQTVSDEIGPAFLDSLRCQHFNRKPKTLLHAGGCLCMVPDLSNLVLSARLPCRNRSGIFIEEQIAVLAHNRVLTDICGAVQEVMEMAIPPLAILHSDHRLFSAELCSNACRRTTGRTIAQLGLLQHSHAEATLR